ncbi:hypothetical protein BDV96DRAFT_605912 [Lophiotrema nucula]|uniref:Uncharacterized protein n=1 Tax=Lophiotrema nucula TaxID=690887 RepID=A0A6A5YM76_9PLEO|nr:hypothetical protein BDV96DRAFT_605912 [Lophiotrema nucula]
MSGNDTKLANITKAVADHVKAQTARIDSLDAVIQTIFNAIRSAGTAGNWSPTEQQTAEYRRIYSEVLIIARENIEWQYSKENRWMFDNGGERVAGVPSLVRLYRDYESIIHDAQRRAEGYAVQWGIFKQNPNGINLSEGEGLAARGSSTY